LISLSAHRVPADHDAAGRGAALGAALEDLAQPGQLRVLVVGVADQVEGRARLAVHGVDVAQGVGGGDLAVGVRVVDDGREEVERLDERNLIGQAVDACVVVGLGADQQVRVG